MRVFQPMPMAPSCVPAGPVYANGWSAPAQYSALLAMGLAPSMHAECMEAWATESIATAASGAPTAASAAGLVRKLRKRRPGKKRRTAALQAGCAAALVVATLSQRCVEIATMLASGDAAAVLANLRTHLGTVAFTNVMLDVIHEDRVPAAVAARTVSLIETVSDPNPDCVLNLFVLKYVVMQHVSGFTNGEQAPSRALSEFYSLAFNEEGESR